VAIYGESLSDINTNINTSSSSSQRGRYYGGSGYTTDVQIIGSEKRFERVRFVPSMFDAWTELFITAQTYDLIVQLKDNGYVNPDGTLKDTVLSLGVPLTPYQSIQFGDIKSHYKNKYTSVWIIDELIRVGVLDNDGFLTNTQSFSDAFDARAFDQYNNAIRSANFKFSSNVISEEMARELLRCLQESSMSIHVTQQETTRYQSRKDGFVDSFLDQLGGHILGRIFYKDQVKTNKRKVVYSPNIHVLNMFTNISFGFTTAPYQHGALGNVIFYGGNTQRVASIQFAKNNDNIEHLGVGVSFLSKQSQSYVGAQQVQASGVNVQVNELRDKTGHNTWMSARLLFGQFGMTHDTQFSFGLANFTSSFRGDSQLGLAFGFNGTHHIMRYFGAYYGLDTNFGFNLFSSEASTTWAVNRINVGVQSAIAPLRFRVGYEWVTGQQSIVFEGMKANVGMYF
jgi:hypothetical protein